MQVTKPNVTPNDPTMDSTTCKKFDPSWDSFFKGPELSKCLLGAFLGIPRLSWMDFDPKNNEKTLDISGLGRLELFTTSEQLMVLFGPSWPLLGPSGPKLVPRMTK